MSATEDTLVTAVPTVWTTPQAKPGQAVVAPPVEPTEGPPGKRPSVAVEKRYRSLLKAISWRATGTMDTIVISFLVTGHIKLAVSIGFVELFTKVGLFYVHERIWTKISLGRTKAPEDYSI